MSQFTRDFSILSPIRQRIEVRKLTTRPTFASFSPPPRFTMEPMNSAVRVSLLVLGTWGAALPPNSLLAEPVPVRHVQGLLHGFLVLRALNGDPLATGDLTQVTHGDRVTSNLAFHFKDSSIHEETAVFSQRRTFRLLTYHLVQKGPAFKRPTDMTVNAATGQVIVRYIDDGKDKNVTDHLKLPADISNGIVTTLMLDIDAKAAKTMLSMVVSTPKPRLVKLAISPDGEDSFSIDGTVRKATRSVIKIEIGGISGVVAPIMGKQPPDTRIWMIGGKAPAFLKSEGPLCDDCPIWRIELASPVWPKSGTDPQR
jgi:hypothetical protein